MNNILVLGDILSIKKYLNFKEHQYFVITSEEELAEAPAELKEIIDFYSVYTPAGFDVACFENNIAEILAIVDRILAKEGTIDYVVTTYEHTVLPAAIIRSKYHINGLTEDKAYVLRNKMTMKNLLEEGGLATPKYSELSPENYQSIIQSYLSTCAKAVIKPMNQAGSQGVLIANNYEDLVVHTENLFHSEEKVMIEEFIDSPIINIDGIVQHGEMKFLSVAKKLGNCYSFVEHKENLATILPNDAALYEQAEAYVKAILAILEINSLVFHLEAFDSHDGFIFLEMAGRYPGGSITELIERVHHFDVVKESYDFDCQKALAKRALAAPAKVSAMLLVPLPEKRDITIRSIEGLNALPNNIIGSSIVGPGEKVTYHVLHPFAYLAKFYIEDESMEGVIATINIITKEVSYHYDFM
ncbi:acetyl-CoA carboxylase biotin carboxylase subunit family protein [Lysinibacillus sp. NPDC098008]|uniref:ATP-grasp domain-containing protein n=1 Tax=Lysinibacillus sp. NPDC098008 TaxID=3364146 RepID=UPI003825341B